MFASGRPRTNTNPTPDALNNSPPGQFPGPITSAAVQARRMSINTLSASGTPNNASGFAGYNRRGSISSSYTSSIDESAIEDDAAGPAQVTPNTPFARRMSFGARALRDVKSGPVSAGGGGADKPNGRSSPSNVALSDSGKKTKVDAPTTSKGRGLSSSLSSNNAAGCQRSMLTRLVLVGEGFNWADNFRTRAERGSIAGASGTVMGGSPTSGHHSRAKSVASMQPPVSEVPKPNVPDHFQERILKGDFYMD